MLYAGFEGAATVIEKLFKYLTVLIVWCRKILEIRSMEFQKHKEMRPLIVGIVDQGD